VVRVPEGANGPIPAESGKGFQFTGGSGGEGGDPPVFVAADLAGVAADLVGELGLGQALLGAELAEPAGEERAGHVVASVVVT